MAWVHFDDDSGFPSKESIFRGGCAKRREWDTDTSEPGSFRFCCVLNAMAANGEFDGWDHGPRGEVLALHRCEEWLFRLQLLP